LPHIAHTELHGRADDSSLLERIDNLQIQFHCDVNKGYTGRELLHRIKSLIVPTHALAWDFPCIWESWQRV
jgi:hypothetical protein